MITATIDANKGGDVATVDIPGAFLQTEQDDDDIIHVKLRAKMATLLAEINPQKYKPYLHTEGGKPVIEEVSIWHATGLATVLERPLWRLLGVGGLNCMYYMTNVWPTRSYAENSALFYGMLTT
jgi:hypothetical protein